MNCDHTLKSNSSKLLERLTGHEAASNYRPTNYLWMCKRFDVKAEGGHVTVWKWRVKATEGQNSHAWISMASSHSHGLSVPPLYPVIFLEMLTGTAILNSWGKTVSYQCGLTAILHPQNPFHCSCCIFKLVLEGISRVVAGYDNSACGRAHGRRFVVIWSIYSRELGFILVRTRYMDETNRVGRLQDRLDSVLHGIWKPILPKKDRVQAEGLAGAMEAARGWDSVARSTWNYQHISNDILHYLLPYE